MKIEERKPFKILCIDGGGIKGLYSAVVLDKLEKKFNCLLSDKFDLICGTSTGGILALAVALKIPMYKAVEMYKKKGGLIFNEKFKRLPLAKYYLIFKQACLGSKYNQKQLKKALKEVYGVKTMGDCCNLVCIPAFNVSTGKPTVFKRDYGTLCRDNNLNCVDVALATAAAPTYFPIHKINNLKYADGGLWANNPTMVGLTEYLFKVSKLNELDYNEVEILSISSFATPKGEVVNKLNRSFLNWRHTIFDTFPTGQSESEMLLLEQLTPHLNFNLKFERIQNCMLAGGYSELLEMDNASAKALEELEAIGNQTADEAIVKPEIINFFKTDKTIVF